MAIQFVYRRSQHVIRRDGIHQGSSNRIVIADSNCTTEAVKSDRKEVWKFEKIASNLASIAVIAAGSGAIVPNTHVTMWSSSCVVMKPSGSRRSARMS